MFDSSVSKSRSWFLPRTLGRRVGRALDKAILRVLRGALSGAVSGRLCVELPSGVSETFGDTGEGSEVRVALRNYRIVSQGMRRGLLGFAECYMDGDIDCNDLGALFNFYFLNEKAIDQIGRGILQTGVFDRMIHALRHNSRRGSRRNISAHYDLGNAFYETWLGKSWFYSSGIFDAPTSTLEDAQRVKCNRIISALQLDGSQSLLEIGCGWGAFALAAAPHTSSVRAITISDEQLAHARKVIKGHGLEDRVNVVFEDYRDTQGQFDRLVSIEMIEAVGENNWSRYFGMLRDRLRPGGVGVLQAITIAPEYFETYRRTPDFIQRYIFPGGMLPTVGKMDERARAAGLAFETVETFGLSYARTLAAWREQFLDAWPRVTLQGFDERFRRMWLYYLQYCEAGFARGTIDVGLYRVTRPVAG
jgi:cyclopropane-fatty-acyl-phospholipid synthase